MKDKYTSDEFRRLLQVGVIEPKGKKRMKYTKPIQAVGEMLASEEEEREVLHKYGYSSTNSIYIKGEVYSSKNSKRIFMKNADKSKWRFNGRTVLPFITDSKAVERYKKSTAKAYGSLSSRFRSIIKDKSLPIAIELVFLRKTEAMFDFGNMCQVVQDQMQEHKWIDNDNVKYLLPYPRKDKAAYYKDPENAGVIIKVL